MKRIFEFIKTTAIGGLLVIVPIAIILFVVGELFLGLTVVAREVVGWLGVGVDDAIVMFAIAALVLVLLCFLTGLLVQTRLGSAVKGWLSRHVARRIPMYNAISSLTKRFAGVEGLQFAPIEVELFGSGARALGFLIEALPDDRSAVFVPSAPVATVGNIYIVNNDRVFPVDASVTDTVTVITQWGVDARDLYEGRKVQAAGEDV